MNRPIRVLHVLGRLDRGGVETWLMHLMRQAKRSELEMDVCALSRNPAPAHYDAEFQQLGGVIHRCPQGRNLLDFSRRFRKLLESQKYDIVHSHVHYFSGFILREAAKCGVPVRISHSHTDRRQVPGEQRWYRRLYIRLMRRWLYRYATRGFACSDAGGRSLWGENWKSDARWRTLYCGIDLSPFANHVPNPSLRSELGIPEGATVWGHVGRFTPVKNHEFLVKLFAEARKKDDSLHLLLVGDGPLRPQIELLAAQLQVSQFVYFAGLRSDVPAIMMDAMDLFVFPSHYEGLGLVVLEAQVARLPCVVSTGVPAEAFFENAPARRLSLHEPKENWVAACLELVKMPHCDNILAVAEGSAFNITNSALSLARAYKDDFNQ